MFESMAKGFDGLIKILVLLLGEDGIRDVIKMVCEMGIVVSLVYLWINRRTDKDNRAEIRDAIDKASNSYTDDQ